MTLMELVANAYNIPLGLVLPLLGVVLIPVGFGIDCIRIGLAQARDPGALMIRGDEYVDGEHRPGGMTLTGAPFCQGQAGMWGCLRRTRHASGFCWQHACQRPTVSAEPVPDAARAVAS